jgi:hypothetical protein
VFRQVLARIERVRYEDIDSEMAVFGDPEYCIERYTPCGANMAWTSSFATSIKEGGIMDHAVVKQSMTSFARGVMPYCR